MAKIEIAKTELVWPGKYNEDGTLNEVPRVGLPFQSTRRLEQVPTFPKNILSIPRVSD